MILSPPVPNQGQPWPQPTSRKHSLAPLPTTLTSSTSSFSICCEPTLCFTNGFKQRKSVGFAYTIGSDIYSYCHCKWNFLVFWGHRESRFITPSLPSPHRHFRFSSIPSDHHLPAYLPPFGTAPPHLPVHASPILPKYKVSLSFGSYKDATW